MPPITQEQIMSRHSKLDFLYIDYIRNGRSFQGIKIQQYIILQMIGQGAFAQIYRGVNQTQNKQVAIKVLNLRTIESQRNPKLKSIKKRLAEEESKIMMKFNSPHILKCYQCFQNRDFKIMILQYCNSGSLQDKIYDHGYIPENEAIYIIKQIINGIGQCHRQKIIHRDLKPDNILIHNGEYKIADFGFSKLLNIQNQQQIVMNTRLGTMITMAPQVLKGQKYGLKADIWSIGVIFFQMLFGQCPFKSDTAIEMVAQITNARLLTQKQYKGISISDSSRKFLRKVLVVDIQKRLGWKELLNHELFSAEGSKLADRFERKFEINTNEEQLQKLGRQFVFLNMSDRSLLNYTQEKTESLINFQKDSTQEGRQVKQKSKVSYQKEQMNEDRADFNKDQKKQENEKGIKVQRIKNKNDLTISFELSKYLPQIQDQKQNHINYPNVIQDYQNKLLYTIQKVNQDLRNHHNEIELQKNGLHLQQSQSFRQSQFLQNQKEQQQQIAHKYQQIKDQYEGQYKKLTAQQRLRIQNNINRQQTQIYKWAQRIYTQCKKTEVIYEQILKPIEENNLLDLKKRQNIEFMYLVSTRCLNNMSPINDAYNKRKNNTIIQELKDTVEKLYQKVVDVWTRYSNLLTSKENQLMTMTLDWFSKKFQKQNIKKKDKYLSGIQNMLDYRTEPTVKPVFKKEQDKDLLDYDKSQQISFTLQYIEKVMQELKQKENALCVIKHLEHYKEICLIDFEDLRKRKFNEYMNIVLL